MIIEQQILDALKLRVRTTGGQNQVARRIGISQSRLSEIINSKTPFQVTDRVGEKILSAVRDLLPEGYRTNRTYGADMALLKTRERRVGWLSEFMEQGAKFCEKAMKACSHEEWILAAGELAMFTSRMYHQAIEARTRSFGESF